jgi:hypothetical protein
VLLPLHHCTGKALRGTHPPFGGGEKPSSPPSHWVRAARHSSPTKPTLQSTLTPIPAPACSASAPNISQGFSWEEKLVAPLIVAPNGEMHKWEHKGTEHKCLTTGYTCNCNAKEITILFCKQIGRSPNTRYAKCRIGLREGKMEMAGNGFSSRTFFVS